MKAVINLDVPEWQIGRPVSVYFPDTMMKKSVCEMLKEQESVKPVPPEDELSLYRCGKCYHPLFRCVDKYCSRCGQAVNWDG